MAFPKIPVAPALVMGGATALLLGVAAAGTLLPSDPVSVFSEDTQMSATGKLIQVAVAPPPKTVVAPAESKLPTMPDNLGDTPVFHAGLQSPPVAPVPAPQARRRAVVEDPAYDDEDEAVEVEPRYARNQPRWRDAPVVIEEYAPSRYRPEPYREARNNRYDEPYGARGYDPRGGYGAPREQDYSRAPAPAYAQPYYRYAEPVYEGRYGR